MKLLLLTRGAPGAGKSTFIGFNGLTPYTISKNAIRLLFSAPMLNPDNAWELPRYLDKQVKKLQHTLVESRMKNGDLTVVDATHSKSKDFTFYKQLADLYQYKVVCIDFSKVELDVLLKRNTTRTNGERHTPTTVEKMYKRIQASSVPSWVEVIEPDAFPSFFATTPIDLSSYKKIHHIGDIHGCYDALSSYLRDGIQEEECYIFSGDYIDRGIQNAQVLRFLFTLMGRKNVFFLEGNHEIHLWNWANNRLSFSKEFEHFTKKELLEHNTSQKLARSFYRQLRPYVFYTYQGKQVLVTHGGISGLPKNLHTVPVSQLIKGVGTYETEIDAIFLGNTDNQTYQIHGHRNIHQDPVQVNERCFNLEGGVEVGRCLRAVTLDEHGFSPFELVNKVFSPRFLNKETETEL